MADGVSVSCSMSRSEEEAGRRVLGHECVQGAGRCGMQGCSCECIDQVGDFQQQARQQAAGKCGAATSKAAGYWQVWCSSKQQEQRAAGRDGGGREE